MNKLFISLHLEHNVHLVCALLLPTQSYCQGIFNVCDSAVSPRSVKWEGILVFTTISRGDAAADGKRQDWATPYCPRQVIFRAGLQMSLGCWWRFQWKCDLPGRFDAVIEGWDDSVAKIGGNVHRLMTSTDEMMLESIGGSDCWPTGTHFHVLHSTSWWNQADMQQDELQRYFTQQATPLKSPGYFLQMINMQALELIKQTAKTTKPIWSTFPQSWQGVCFQCVERIPMASGGGPCPYMVKRHKENTRGTKVENSSEELDVWVYGSLSLFSNHGSTSLTRLCVQRGRHSGGNKANVCPRNRENYNSASAEVPESRIPQLPPARPLPNAPF